MRFVLSCFLYFVLACCIAASPVNPNAYLNASRINTRPQFLNPSGLKEVALAKAYLEANQNNLKAAQTELVFRRKRESLLGTHYYFQQTFDGVPVEGGVAVVSIAHSNGQIYKSHTSIYPLQVDEKKADKKLAMDANAAMETAWQKVALRGDFYAQPKAELCYFVNESGPHLAYRVSLPNLQPLGDWSMVIDAINGSLLQFKNLQRDAKRGSLPLRDEATPADSFGAALQRWEAHKSALASKKESGKKADGEGYVFDPDPLTYLMTNNLNDSSEPSVFSSAYVSRTLREITFSNGSYKLTGPWVNIQALSIGSSSPGTQPSTTTDGLWHFQRGNNAFNDAMTYFQLDQSQRYIQSLGFTDAKGIQQLSIPVDTDGAGGADNSFFSPSSNSLVFGHGCVDDNEDADVILHEYGHALQFSINDSWSNGGDEGAMGEGFGDYWAGSYSMSIPQGYLFQPFKMFNWDAIGECWGGRSLDKTHLLYQPNSHYGAHQSVPGTFDQTDEMWSAPLFGSLRELFQQGIPRSEVDQIVLEGHFGLGSNNTMASTALSIVQAAERLYPNGPHAGVFRKYFAAQEMLGAETNYSYFSNHIPPSRSSADWQNQIELHNPGTSTATVVATLYEQNSGTFSAQSQVTLSLSPGETYDFIPSGTAQRWVRFDSDLPLTGVSNFQRRPSEELGSEKAAIPLIGKGETATSLIFPHIPADRVRFWSGAVLLNPSDETVDLTFELIGTDGNPVGTLTDVARASLAPHEKWVTFLASNPGIWTGLFDDSSSSEKVSWVRVNASAQINGFQLYGYNSTGSKVATAGIIALPDQAHHVWPVRMSTDQVDWAAINVLNPSDTDTNLSVKAFNADGVLAGSGSMTVPARAKKLGLNAGGSLVFPTIGDKILNLNNGNEIQTLVFESPAPLRIFDLSGDNASSALDGAAVLGTTTRTVFTRPSGKLELFKALYAGTIQVNFLVNGLSQDSTLEMQPDSSQTLDIPENAESVTIFGELFTANVVKNDPASGYLTIVHGKQVE